MESSFSLSAIFYMHTPTSCSFGSIKSYSYSAISLTFFTYNIFLTPNYNLFADARLGTGFCLKGLFAFFSSPAPFSLTSSVAALTFSTLSVTFPFSTLFGLFPPLTSFSSIYSSGSSSSSNFYYLMFMKYCKLYLFAFLVSGSILSFYCNF